MKKVVTVIGGGTGLRTILEALKLIRNIKINAVVAVSDDGGNTQKFREEFNLPAIGDLRQALVALSADENFFSSLMDYRFNHDITSDIYNYSLGNLILTALIDHEKDFTKGIAAAGKFLALKGTVIPVSLQNITLSCLYDNGSIADCERLIPNINLKIKKVFYKKEPLANKKALLAIKSADILLLSIGSLYTSILANLTIPQIKEVFLNATGKKIYISNLTTEPGETDEMHLNEHLNAIDFALAKNCLDLILYNNSSINKSLKKRYNTEFQKIIQNNVIQGPYQNKIIAADLIDANNYRLLRHDIFKTHDILKKVIFCKL